MKFRDAKKVQDKINTVCTRLHHIGRSLERLSRETAELRRLALTVSQFTYDVLEGAEVNAGEKEEGTG